MSAPTFADLGVLPAITQALSRRKIEEPFQIQALVMSDALAGTDVLAGSRTGSGKTLAFGIPIVQLTSSDAKAPAALVLVPTRELASQVSEEIQSIATVKNLKVAAVYGGVNLPEQAKRAARAHIIVATPGRLEDLASRNLLRLGDVKILVLDEADRMLDMGFQPQIQRIVRRLPKQRQTMFFSATLDGQIGQLAKAYTNNPKTHSVESDRETVDEASHEFVQVSTADKVATLVKALGNERGATLVFVKTKRGADRLTAKLKAQGIRAAAMHGDMTQSARQRALASFASGSMDTLVATDVAARGIDLDNISHVINFDPPEDHKSYIHRVGRTARAGRQGIGITFVTADQLRDVSHIAVRLKLKEQFEEGGMKIASPRIAYTSSRRGGSMMARRRRKF